MRVRIALSFVASAMLGIMLLSEPPTFIQH